jgi:hypothetical protein
MGRIPEFPLFIIPSSISVHQVRQAKTGFSIDLKSNQHVK